MTRRRHQPSNVIDIRDGAMRLAGKARERVAVTDPILDELRRSVADETARQVYPVLRAALLERGLRIVR
jgi:hypothetical protein